MTLSHDVHDEHDSKVVFVVASWLILEARREVELPEPPAPGTIQRPHVIQLQNRVAERIQSQGGADAAHPVAAAAERRRFVVFGPRGARVAKEGDLDWQRSVE